MRRRTRLFALGLVAPLPIFAAGCSSGEQEAPPEHAVYAKIDEDFRQGMAEVFAIADHCQGSSDDACAENALAQLRSAGGIRAQADLPVRITTILYASRKQICRKIYDIAKGFHRLYYSVGITGEAGGVVVGAVGLERVWDLNDHQSAAFAYASGGVSNLAGFSGKAYVGYTWARVPKANVIDAFSGVSLNVGVGVAIPETDIGVDGQLTANPDGSTIGIMVGASIGINAFNPGVTGSVSVAGYLPFDDLTKLIGDPVSSRTIEGGPNARYVQFRDGKYLNRGAGTAANILLTFPFALGATQAAYVTYGAYLLAKAQQTLEGYCGVGSVASAPPPPTTDCGMSTASLRPQACNGNDGELPDFVPSTPAPPSPPPPPPPRNCFYEDNGCESIFPGQNLVCSQNGAQTYCCRAPFEGAQCDTDEQCPSGQICARRTNDPSIFRKKACLDPKKPQTACATEGAP